MGDSPKWTLVLEPYAPKQKRTVAFIPAGSFIEGHGWRVSFVVEGEAGHSPTGTWPYEGKPGQKLPWFFGPTYDDARHQAEQYNAAIGIDEYDADQIVTWSMVLDRKKEDSAGGDQSLRAIARRYVAARYEHVERMSAALDACIQGTAEVRPPDWRPPPAPTYIAMKAAEECLRDLVARLRPTAGDELVEAARDLVAELREPWRGYDPNNPEEVAAANARSERHTKVWARLAKAAGYADMPAAISEPRPPKVPR